MIVYWNDKWDKTDKFFKNIWIAYQERHNVTGQEMKHEDSE